MQNHSIGAMKIILCTTFRDFNGTDNDQIQYMFLDSIKNQSYQDFLVVTTIFGEQHVKKVVDGYFGPKSVTTEVSLPSEYRFSLTDVVLNAISVVKSLHVDCVVIWCTCDIKLSPNLFQLLVDNYKAGFSGIVHPNICYKSIDDLNRNNNPKVRISSGIDLLFFDGRLLADAEKEIAFYRFYDWGFFEHFLVGIALLYSKDRINLYCNSHLLKVENDRELTEESKAYFKRCVDLNRPVMSRFYSDKGLINDIIKRNGLYGLHCQYRMLSPNQEYVGLRNNYIGIPTRLLILAKYYMFQLLVIMGIKKDPWK